MQSSNLFTRNPSDRRQKDLLEAIASEPDTLVVLNHPLWDQAGIGLEAHAALLVDLLQSSGAHLHALELNGLRPWEENQQVLRLAAGSGRTVVSGGDRHGSEPASAVNVTSASSFAEFAAEVREGWSQIFLLPHYREALKYRLVKSVFDIMGDYPELPGREHWTDRVLCQRYTGETCSLAALWPGKLPAVVRSFERVVHLAGMHALRCISQRYFVGRAAGAEHAREAHSFDEPSVIRCAADSSAAQEV